MTHKSSHWVPSSHCYHSLPEEEQITSERKQHHVSPFKDIHMCHPSELNIGYLEDRDPGRVHVSGLKKPWLTSPPNVVLSPFQMAEMYGLQIGGDPITTYVQVPSKTSRFSSTKCRSGHLAALEPLCRAPGFGNRPTQ